MADNIEFTLYDRERDIESVVNLLRRNKFYLGKLDQELDVERYIEYQERRGFQLAVVARADNEVIGHIALYLNGNQGVAREGEIYLSSALVDRKYQRLMPSIGNLYMLAMDAVTRRNYKAVICDTGRTNFASLYMLRRLGGILLNGEPNMYGNYSVQIYTPIVVETFGKKSLDEMIEAYGQLYGITKPLDKRKAKEQTELIDNKYALIVYDMKEYVYNLYINVVNANMGKLEVVDHIQVSLLENDSKIAVNTYRDKDVHILFYEEDKVVREETLAMKKGEQEIYDLSDRSQKVYVKCADMDTPIVMYPRPVKKSAEAICQMEQAGAELTLQDGYLRFKDEEKPLMVEMWPCITRPVLFGYLTPKEMDLKQEKIEDNHFRIIEENSKYTLYREYKTEENKVTIYSYVDIKDEFKLDILLHIAMDNLKYNCKIVTDNETVQKTYSEKDKDFCNEEMLYEYFGGESYAEEFVKEVNISFDNQEFKITTDRDMYCFYQFNYIGFRFTTQAEVLKPQIGQAGTQIELGTLTIERSRK